GGRQGRSGPSTPCTRTRSCRSRAPSCRHSRGTRASPAFYRSASRLDSEHGAFVLVRDDVEQPVGPLGDIADALAEIEKQRFAAKLLEARIEQDAIEPAGARDLAVA